jgi:uncharacterized low-complexity protein
MSKKTLIATAVGSAFVAGMAAAPIASAAENPFVMHALDKGYRVAQAGKMGDGKCGGMKANAAENTCGAAMMDTNKDGKVSKEEFVKAHEAQFGAMDANQDGFLDKTEMGKMMDGQCGGAKMPMQGKCGGMK